MSAETKIEWCDDTFNAWKICTPVSPGCVNCYAAAMAKRYGWGEYKKGVPRKRTSPANWKQPLKWNQEPWVCDECGTAHALPGQICMKEGCQCETKHRRRVFCLSLGDWLDDEVPIEWLADLLKLIHDTPNLDWLLLTKRPGNWRDRLCEAMVYLDKDVPRANEAEAAELYAEGKRLSKEEFRLKYKRFFRSDVSLWVGRWGEGDAPANVWIGATVENQAMADERIPELLRIPAKVRFLSCEPLLESLDLRRWSEQGLECSICAWRGCESLSPGEKNFHDRDPEDTEYECPECGEPCAHTPLDELLGSGIHWVIIGGESGPKARVCNVAWIRSLVSQCQAAKVACFVKQLGADSYYDPSVMSLDKVGMGMKSHKDPKGGDMAEWPVDLRIRQFPTLNSQPYALN